MVEAKNFVEKELGKSLEEEQTTEQAPETKESIPTYTPPPPPVQEPVSPVPQFFPQPPVIQIVEKVIYKKQRIHGFFRTLTLIALLAIGFLMLGESTWLLELSVNSFSLHQIYPLVIILSTIIIWSYKWLLGKIFWLILFLAVFWWIFTIGVYTSLNPSTKRKEWTAMNYTLPKSDTSIKKNIYIQTLVGNSYIEGSGKENKIQWTWNSDRNLIVTSWANTNVSYLKLNEDRNWNVLQNYVSNIDLTLPSTTRFDLLYIKNFVWLHTIDLTTFQWKMLKIHGSINDITVRVGNVSSGNKIEIQWTAANVDVEIPNDVWVMLYYKHYVGKLEVAQFQALSGHYFQSLNFETAKKKMEIYINLWAGNTKINRVEPKNN